MDTGQGLVTVPCWAGQGQVCQTNIHWVIAAYVLTPIGGILTAKALASEWARRKAHRA